MRGCPKKMEQPRLIIRTLFENRALSKNSNQFVFFRKSKYSLFALRFNFQRPNILFSGYSLLCTNIV